MFTFLQSCSCRPILPPPLPKSKPKGTDNDTTNTIIKPLQNLTVNAVSNSTLDKALHAKGLVTSNPTPRKRLSTQELESLSGRQRKCLREAQQKAYLEHLYKLKLDIKKSKLMRIMDAIFKLADNDLIVCNFDTGLNDYTKNLNFADELETMSKELAVLSNDCSEKATKIRDRIAQAKENKRLIQDVVYQTEIVKESEKCDEIRYVRPDVNYVPKPYISKECFSSQT